MNKLFALVAASAFALVSATSFAANDVNHAQAKPAVKHTSVHKSQQTKATVHKVKQAKKKHAKRSTKKARRAV
jgi:uncharacterized low-complexity protein